MKTRQETFTTAMQQPVCGPGFAVPCCVRSVRECVCKSFRVAVQICCFVVFGETCEGFVDCILEPTPHPFD